MILFLDTQRIGVDRNNEGVQNDTACKNPSRTLVLRAESVLVHFLKLHNAGRIEHKVLVETPEQQPCHVKPVPALRCGSSACRHGWPPSLRDPRPPVITASLAN